jgi:hypothetical protein
MLPTAVARWLGRLEIVLMIISPVILDLAGKARRSLARLRTIATRHYCLTPFPIGVSDSADHGAACRRRL